MNSVISHNYQHNKTMTTAETRSVSVTRTFLDVSIGDSGISEPESAGEEGESLCVPLLWISDGWG
jgi:hypothetical protein